ncbi:MAG: PAS domain S-box protein [Rhodocyclaceae bacterium]|nr:PAS domain S-box protein [Rhodocyclaceae bacterium]MDZ4216509.1 PAS domain S-box protein [Rhodocyclaceae bacterium]
MRLWLYLTLIVNGIVLLAFTGYGAYTAHELTSLKAEEVRRDSRNLAQSIAATTANDILTSRFDNIESHLLRMVTIGSIQELVVADGAGRILVHVERGPDGSGRAVYGDLNQPLDLQRAEWSTADVYSTLLAIERGQRLGWVRITASLAALEAERRRVSLNGLVASLVTMLITGFLLAMLIRKTSKSIEQATLFASSLIHHRGATLPLNSRIREVQEFTKALNSVSQTLASQYQTLADSESRKSAILTAGLDCFITIDDTGHIVDFNRAAEQTFGYSADEVRGGLMSDFIIPPELRSQHKQGMEHWRRTGDGPVLHQRIEISAMRRSGEIFPVELAIVPFGNRDRQYFAGFIRDISQRKALELQRNQLEATQGKMVADLENKQFAIDQHAIVSIATPDGTIVYANERLQALSGYSAEELVGSNHRLLKSGLQDGAFYRELWQTISSGKVWHGEYANRGKSGQIYWVAATIVPMLNKDGSPHQYISIQTDITHQKRTEQQLGLFQEDLIRLLDQYRTAEAEIAESRARELMVGAQIQRTLLFGRMPRQYGNVGIATFTQPSQGIDGDFYEFFTFDKDTIDIVIGDVMGKGIPAALMGAAVKKQLNRSAAWLLSQNPMRGYRPAPKDILNDLQQRVGNDLLELESFVTLSYLRIDSSAGLAVLVDAGHLPVIQVSDNGVTLLRGDNLPLGVLEEEHYHQTTVTASSGDIFFMYSDGITEARNADKEEFGIDRLVHLIQGMHAAGIPQGMIVQNVRWHVNEFENHADAQDDRTCVALQLARAMPAGMNIRQFEIPRALDQLAPLRSRIEVAGKEAALDEAAIQSMLIAAFEAATNIVRHTPPRLVDATIHCALTIQPNRLEVDLHYLGNAFTPHDSVPDFSGESEGGFGLYIIRNSVDSVEYSSPVDGICRIHLVKSSAGVPT